MQAAHEVVALAGFHIKRQEFEPEYDNEAEMIVADMEFRDDDTEVGMHACTFLSRHEPEGINIVNYNSNIIVITTTTTITTMITTTIIIIITIIILTLLLLLMMLS